MHSITVCNNNVLDRPFQLNRIMFLITYSNNCIVIRRRNSSMTYIKSLVYIKMIIESKKAVAMYIQSFLNIIVLEIIRCISDDILRMSIYTYKYISIFILYARSHCSHMCFRSTFHYYIEIF